MSVQAGLDLSVELGSLRQEIRDNRRRDIERANALVPIDHTEQTSAVCPTPTASFALNLGGPDAGFYWLVRRILVGGLTWSTTAAGTAEAYVTGLNTPSGATLGIASARTIVDMVDQASSLPNKAFYGRHGVVVQANQTLIVVIVSGTAGQQYTASAGVQVLRTIAAIESHQ